VLGVLGAPGAPGFLEVVRVLGEPTAAGHDQDVERLDLVAIYPQRVDLH
jgi:hypothetical protein